MEPKEKEEELLKSVALQTANAVLVARRRAEHELIRIKDALQNKSAELTRSLSMRRSWIPGSRWRGPESRERISGLPGLRPRADKRLSTRICRVRVTQ